MGQTIKGITVEIGGNTTGLNKALAGTNKEIINTQKELKQVERLLKLDPTNTELLAQKQALLSKQVSETSNKLDVLKEAEKQVQEQFKNGEVTKAQYDELKREIIATEQSLNDLEKAAAQSNVALAEISVVAGKVAESTDNLANKTRGLSVAATGALAGLAGMATSAFQGADDLNTLAKQPGFSTEQLQKWQYAADTVDVSVDDIISSAKKMKKNMDSTSADVTEAWETLGISVRDSNGELRDSKEVFEETLVALSKVENETERDILAMTLFGKSADNLAGIVDDGGAALKALGEEAENAGLILSQDALDSANEFNDAVDKIKATAAGSFAEIGTEIVEMLLPYMDDLSETIMEALAWFRSLDEEQLKMLGTILLVVAAISPLLTAISKVSAGIQFLTGTVLPALSSGISFIASNPIVLLVAAIVGLVTLMATSGDEILAILNNVDSFLQNVFAVDWTNIFGPVLGNILNSFFANLKNTWDSIKQIFTGVINFICGAFTGDWTRAWNGIKDIFGGVFNSLTSIAKAPINGVIGLLNMAISAVNEMIRGFNSIGFDLPDWLGGYSWHPSIKTIPSIAYLAKGGILNSGTAVVGEAGPEILTMAGNKAVVQPLSGSAVAGNGLSDIMNLLSLYLPFLAQSTDVVLDTGEIVGVLGPKINDEMGRMEERERSR